jgi:hypothetical protein
MMLVRWWWWWWVQQHFSFRVCREKVSFKGEEWVCRRSRRISFSCMEGVMEHGVGTRRWIYYDERVTKPRRWISSAVEEITTIPIMWNPS